jgi:tRNA (adenine58-N1)-methyltransferase non-catalytic subunit
MTGRGGAEGYLFTGVRVVPAVGRVEARGKFVRKKVVEGEKGVEKEGGEEGSPKRVKLDYKATGEGNVDVTSSTKFIGEEREETRTRCQDVEGTEVQMA